MFITQYQDGNTLLTYSLGTAPLPVQVSPASGPPAIAMVTLVVSLPKDVPKVTVTRITVTLPIANPAEPDAADLATTDVGIGHSVSSSGADQWTNDTGSARGTFVIKPKNGQTGVIDGQGLTISFPNIQVSPIVGTSWIKITEVATLDSGPAQSKTTMIAVAKFPEGFFAGNFAPVATRVQNGQATELKWNGSPGAIYTMLWDGNTEDVSKFRAWKTPPLVRQTIFMLSVAAQRGAQTTILYFSVTVDVANPDLLAKSLDVHEAARIKGNTVLGGNASIAGTAEINGAATVKNHLSVAGLASAGRLLSNGQAVVGGDLAVGGAATLGALATLGGGANVGGHLNVSGAVSIFGRSGTIPQFGDFPAAPTDGFVIGAILPTNQASGTITLVAQSGGVSVSATGSGVGNNFHGGSFVLPVRKGEIWRLRSIGGGSGNVGLYWVSLGTTPLRAKQLAAKKKSTLPGIPLPKASAPARREDVSFSGHAKLAKGRATVRLSAIAGLRSFSKGKRDYVVQLTPLGECAGLAVVKKTAGSFTIVELGGGRSSLPVDWTIHFC